MDYCKDCNHVESRESQGMAPFRMCYCPKTMVSDPVSGRIYRDCEDIRNSNYNCLFFEQKPNTNSKPTKQWWEF